MTRGSSLMVSQTCFGKLFFFSFFFHPQTEKNIPRLDLNMAVDTRNPFRNTHVAQIFFFGSISYRISGLFFVLATLKVTLDFWWVKPFRI
jgi:hypothetical protein